MTQGSAQSPINKPNYYDFAKAVYGSLTLSGRAIVAGAGIFLVGAITLLSAAALHSDKTVCISEDPSPQSMSDFEYCGPEKSGAASFLEVAGITEMVAGGGLILTGIKNGQGQRGYIKGPELS